MDLKRHRLRCWMQVLSVLARLEAFEYRIQDVLWTYLGYGQYRSICFAEAPQGGASCRYTFRPSNRGIPSRLEYILPSDHHFSSFRRADGRSQPGGSTGRDDVSLVRIAVSRPPFTRAPGIAARRGEGESGREQGSGRRSGGSRSLRPNPPVEGARHDADAYGPARQRAHVSRSLRRRSR